MSERKRIAWVGTSAADIQIGEVIYVLHTFKKKATIGISTARRDLALIEERLKIAKKLS